MLGALVVIGFFAVLVVLLLVGTSPDIANIMLGALVGAFGTVVGYFYGSSKSSGVKDEMIGNYLNGKKLELNNKFNDEQ